MSDHEHAGRDAPFLEAVGYLGPALLGMLVAFENGDLAEARKWHARLFPLCRDLLGLATNPIPIKAAMGLLGRDTGEVRLPMTPLASEELANLKTTLFGYGLLSATG